MILNTLLGFIIPWIVALIIISDHKIIYYIGPFAGFVSFIINDVGFFFFWNLYPFNFYYLSALPFNLGLFPLFPCFTEHFIRKYNIKPLKAILSSALVITIYESLGVLIGRVIYRNEWNLLATYFS